jgi:hypothetical protein
MSNRAGKNVFQLWKDNGGELPFVVQKMGWDKNSWFVVTQVVLSPRQCQYFEQTGNMYGKAFGFFTRRGEKLVDQEKVELRNSGVYKWQYVSEDKVEVLHEIVGSSRLKNVG